MDLVTPSKSDDASRSSLVNLFVRRPASRSAGFASSTRSRLSADQAVGGKFFAHPASDGRVTLGNHLTSSSQPPFGSLLRLPPSRSSTNMIFWKSRQQRKKRLCGAKRHRVLRVPASHSIAF